MPVCVEGEIFIVSYYEPFLYSYPVYKDLVTLVGRSVNSQFELGVCVGYYVNV